MVHINFEYSKNTRYLSPYCIDTCYLCPHLKKHVFSGVYGILELQKHSLSVTIIAITPIIFPIFFWNSPDVKIKFLSMALSKIQSQQNEPHSFN